MLPLRQDWQAEDTPCRRLQIEGEVKEADTPASHAVHDRSHHDDGHHRNDNRHDNHNSRVGGVDNNSRTRSSNNHSCTKNHAVF